jgi:flagellar biosynthesis protein FlhG
MAKFVRDQADGLRRLLARDFVRIVTVTSGCRKVGKTSVVVNLAAALTRAGRDVLIIDENADDAGHGLRLGVTARYDLLDVMEGRRSLEEVIVTAPQGMTMLPAGRALRVLADTNDATRGHLVECFRKLASPADIVLVDAVRDDASRLLPLDLPSHEIGVVVSSDAASITKAYALIKRITQSHAKQRFHILMNRVASEAAARDIFCNLADVASRFLCVTLDFMGHIPADESLKQSNRLNRPVVDAFPMAPSAASYRRMAELLGTWPCQDDASGGLQNFMQRLIQGSGPAAAGLTL